MGYSLDGQENVTIAGNTNLTGLSHGAHFVTVYANDTADNMGSSDTVHFTRGYTLTVDSVPTGVIFMVDSIPWWTPWSGAYSEDTSVSLVMLETHDVSKARYARYYWDRWSDGVTTQSRTVTMNTDISLTAYYTGPYYELAVKSSPISGVTFTLNGAPETTPHTEWLPEDSYTLEMPETHTVGEAKYYWNQWSDGDTSRSRTVTLDKEITLTGDFAGTYYELTVASSPITGIAFTIDEVLRTTPYIERLPEGSYTLEMPETHVAAEARYYWDQW
jgi:hypothetical protein